LQLADQIVHR